VCHALVEPFTAQAHLHALGVEQLESRDTEFGAFLQGLIHAVAPGQRLHDGNPERRFGDDWQAAVNAQRHAAGRRTPAA
jgi:hypothetical protein